jgi:hypothetical protein
MPPAWQRIQLFYWQHQCLNYSPPENAAVFTDQSSATSATLHDSINSVTPLAWSRFYQLISPPGIQSEGTIFLHELIRPDGRTRLVAVDLNFDLQDAGHLIEARVFSTGSILHRPKQLGNYCSRRFPFTPLDLVVFAGQPDPADRSHFTFKIREGSRNQIYDGWLQNDDTVSIGERTPTTQP